MKKIVFICSYIFYSSIPNYGVSEVQPFFQIQELVDQDDLINPLYVRNSTHPCDTMSIVAEIASEVYNVRESIIYKKLLKKKTLYKINVPKLRLNLFAQTRNYKKLKELLRDDSEVNLIDLKTLLFFVEGKRYYKEFEGIEKNARKKGSIKNQDYQECISLIFSLANNKI